ncbi:outer membrane protein assembly factor BamB family protein [Natrinema pallidum]|uniref:Pyrrolo-quinoline quinone repeat domain-containing protein n=1 Tax=Natrinema pallidum DSM 3751 TaxID=1227495 RepID=L9Z4C5_9EURY|nr:hypothetical protein C487_04073 [Natrinema pallidum DSM 3751]
MVDGTVSVGDTNGTLYALEAASGDERWTSTATGTVRTPAVVGDTVSTRAA